MPFALGALWTTALWSAELAAKVCIFALLRCRFHYLRNLVASLSILAMVLKHLVGMAILKFSLDFILSSHQIIILGQDKISL